MVPAKHPPATICDAARLLANGFRFLRFPEPLEAEFRNEHRAKLRKWNRLAIWIAACTVCGFAILDLFILSPNHARIRCHNTSTRTHTPDGSRICTDFKNSRAISGLA